MTPSLESSSVTANDFDNSIIVRVFLITISIGMMLPMTVATLPSTLKT
jgi:hypothetical protein